MQLSAVDCLQHGLPSLSRRHETRPASQYGFTPDVHEPCRTEPLSVFVLRIGLTSIIFIDENQIESHGLWRRRACVIENMTDDVYCAIRIHCGTDILYRSSRIFGRQHLENTFQHRAQKSAVMLNLWCRLAAPSQAVCSLSLPVRPLCDPHVFRLTCLKRYSPLPTTSAAPARSQPSGTSPHNKKPKTTAQTKAV